MVEGFTRFSEVGQRLEDLNFLAFREQDILHHSVLFGRHLENRLFRLDGENHLALLDGVILFLEPLNNLPGRTVLTDLRHDHRNHSGISGEKKWLRCYPPYTTR